MKRLNLVLLFIAVIGLIFSLAHAAGDAEKGKVLFNDTHFAGAVSGKSCNSCHPGGRGLEMAGGKTEFKIMGKTQNSLEDAVNLCIVNAIKGKVLDSSSEEMQDVVSYIRSLEVKME